MPRRLLGLLCMLLTTGLLLAAVPMGVIGDDETPVRVIVLFEDEVDEDLIEDNGGSVDHKYTYIPAVVADLKPSAIKKLEKSDKVKSVEEDAVAYAVDDVDEAKGKPTPPPPPPPPAQDTPWGVDRIDADLVWDENDPKTGGEGIDVAIVDTGIDKDHPDLKDHIGGGVNYVSSRGKIDSAAWDDDNGHGTHCAGIVGALNNSIGVIGVAPNVTLYAVKVLNKQGSGSYSNIIAGIEWCIASLSDEDLTYDIDVISMSLSGTYNDPALMAECNKAQAAGIVLVAAAGNSASATSEYPAAYDSVISVGATDSSDDLAYFSNYGEKMDLVAPGVLVYSTYKGGTYKTLSGTSMACPHVAGTVALVLAVGDASDFGNGNTAWTPAEVLSCLLLTADDLGITDPYGYYEYGLVDAEQAATGTQTNP